MLFISWRFNDSSVPVHGAWFTVSGSFVVFVTDVLGNQLLNSFSLPGKMCASGLLPPPAGELKDVQGEPGWTGEPSGGTAWFRM